MIPFRLAGALLAFAAPAAAATEADRLRTVQDKLEIRQLLLDYGRTLDAQDYPSYGALFARAGQWVGGGAPATGPAAIAARMARTFGPGSGAKWTTDHHIFSDPIVEVAGDRATAWSRWLFVSPAAGDRPQPMYGGHYDDRLVREDGRWRFARREVVADIVAPAR